MHCLRLTGIALIAIVCQAQIVVLPVHAGKRLLHVRVLLPHRGERPLKTVYLLPVEPGDEHRFGDPLETVRALGLHERFGVACVAPEFVGWPWYGDHPSDPALQQESFFLKTVIPLVERTQSVQADGDARFLIGFSKSGWGAFTLALRHPNAFGGIAAWDAPLMASSPDQWEMRTIFGTNENFARYRVSKLLEQQAAAGPPDFRIVLLGNGVFRQDSEAAHRLMLNLHIPHVYESGPARGHRWDSGWLPEAFEHLLR
jgi:hypothetical protein